MGVIMKNKVNYTGGGGSGGASALVDLEDVELTTPTDGQALVYDETNNAWINGNVSGGTLVIQDASIYSTDEQQVGVWTDGRPIYKKTWIFDTYITISQNSIFSLASKGVSISNLGVITSSEAIMTLDKRSMFPVSVGMRSGNISIFNYSGLQIDMDGITLYYTKTTDSTGSGGYKAYGLSPIIYSEEEREVGVWIDGKPLYQKTISFGQLPSANSSKSIAHNISNFDFMRVESFFAVQNGYYTNMPYVSYMSNVGGGEMYLTNTDIIVRTGILDLSGYAQSYVTIQYTKTTDTAGSGIWTTTGEYAHHYSTDEKVVGTWIDGKPIYEKCIDGGTLPNNTFKNIAHGISNLDNVIECKGWARSGSDRHVIPIVNSASAGYQVGFYINDTNIIVGDSYNYSSYTTSYFIIRYTKTTD